MNRYERFCGELFPDLYKIAYLISGDSSAASELAINTVVQGVHCKRSMKNLTDARIELMRILYTACIRDSFGEASSSGCGKLAELDHPDRCFVVFRHCSGLRFQDFCRITGRSGEQARRHLTKIASAIQLSR